MAAFTRIFAGVTPGGGTTRHRGSGGHAAEERAEGAGRHPEGDREDPDARRCGGLPEDRRAPGRRAGHGAPPHARRPRRRRRRRAARWARRRRRSRSNNAAFPAQVTSMMDIIAHAFACDVTRVMTLQLSYAFSHVVHTWLGHTSGHHDMSHDGTDRRTELQAIDNWYAKQIAYLVGQLDAVNEGNGTLLDNTLIVMGRELGSTAHRMDRSPLLLIGKAGGALRTGRFLNYDKQEHVKLLVSICQLIRHVHHEHRRSRDQLRAPRAFFEIARGAVIAPCGRSGRGGVVPVIVQSRRQWTGWLEQRGRDGNRRHDERRRDRDRWQRGAPGTGGAMIGGATGTGGSAGGGATGDRRWRDGNGRRSDRRRDGDRWQRERWRDGNGRRGRGQRWRGRAIGRFGWCRGRQRAVGQRRRDGSGRRGRRLTRSALSPVRAGMRGLRRREGGRLEHAGQRHRRSTEPTRPAARRRCPSTSRRTSAAASSRTRARPCFPWSTRRCGAA